VSIRGPLSGPSPYTSFVGTEKVEAKVDKRQGSFIKTHGGDGERRGGKRTLGLRPANSTYPCAKSQVREFGLLYFKYCVNISNDII